MNHLARKIGKILYQKNHRKLAPKEWGHLHKILDRYGADVVGAMVNNFPSNANIEKPVSYLEGMCKKALPPTKSLARQIDFND